MWVKWRKWIEKLLPFLLNLEDHFFVCDYSFKNIWKNRTGKISLIHTSSFPHIPFIEFLVCAVAVTMEERHSRKSAQKPALYRIRNALCTVIAIMINLTHSFSQVKSYNNFLQSTAAPSYLLPLFLVTISFSFAFGFLTGDRVQTACKNYVLSTSQKLWEQNLLRNDSNGRKRKKSCGAGGMSWLGYTVL